MFLIWHLKRISSSPVEALSYFWKTKFAFEKKKKFNYLDSEFKTSLIFVVQMFPDQLRIFVNGLVDNLLDDLLISKSLQPPFVLNDLVQIWILFLVEQKIQTFGDEMVAEEIFRFEIGCTGEVFRPKFELLYRNVLLVAPEL